MQCAVASAMRAVRIACLARAGQRSGWQQFHGQLRNEARVRHGMDCRTSSRSASSLRCGCMLTVSLRERAHSRASYDVRSVLYFSRLLRCELKVLSAAALLQTWRRARRVLRRRTCSLQRSIWAPCARCAASHPLLALCQPHDNRLQPGACSQLGAVSAVRKAVNRQRHAQKPTLVSAAVLPEAAAPPSRHTDSPSAFPLPQAAAPLPPCLMLPSDVDPICRRHGRPLRHLGIQGESWRVPASIAGDAQLGTCASTRLETAVRTAAHTLINAWQVTGLCAATFTPFVEDSSPAHAVDLPSIAVHADELVAQGVKHTFGECTIECVGLQAAAAGAASGRDTTARELGGCCECGFGG